MKRLLYKPIKFFVAIAFLALYAGCQPVADQFTIIGTINGAAGDYLKIMDMSSPGFPVDSVPIDLNHGFSYSQQTSQPKDLILYLKQPDYIRLVAGVNEVITIQSAKTALLENLLLSGSEESALVSELLKKHMHSVQVIDTLERFYLKNQMQPNIDELASQLTQIADSIYRSEKEQLENFIVSNPGSIAAYIALSFKLGPNRNLFTLQNDLPLFEMVDTALQNRYDTIAISKMLNTYVLRGKMQQQRQNKQHVGSLMGQKAPDIALPNVWGDTLSLSELKGKYVLVDFWGSWCRPCRSEHENLRKTYRMFRYKGFEIFQVAIERNKTDWKNTLREDKLYWKYQVSELNYMESKTAKAYRVKAIPANYLLDPNGIVVAQNLYGDALIEKLNELLNPLAGETN
ncbi:MAG: TlpA family protein disulfide reductase [Salinivirgaceae bacterium]